MSDDKLAAVPEKNEGVDRTQLNYDQCVTHDNTMKFREISKLEKSDKKEETKEGCRTCAACGQGAIDSRLLELNECKHAICKLCATNGFIRLIGNTNYNKLCIYDLTCFAANCQCKFEYNESLFILNGWLNNPLSKCYEILNVVYYNSVTGLSLTDYNDNICSNVSRLHKEWGKEYGMKKQKHGKIPRRQGKNRPALDYKHDLIVLKNKMENAKSIMKSNRRSSFKCNDCKKRFKLHQMVVLKNCLHMYCLSCIEAYVMHMLSIKPPSLSDKKNDEKEDDVVNGNITNKIENREHEPFELTCPKLVYNHNSKEYYPCNCKLTQQDMICTLLYGSMGPNDTYFEYFEKYQNELLLNELKRILSSHYVHCATTDSNIREARGDFIDALPERWQIRLDLSIKQNKYLRNESFVKEIKLLNLYYEKYMKHFENAKQSIIDSRRILIRLRSENVSENDKTNYVFEKFNHFLNLNIPFCIKVMARAFPYFVKEFEKINGSYNSDNNSKNKNKNNNNNDQKYENAEFNEKLKKLMDLKNEMYYYVYRPIAKIPSLESYFELLGRCEESLTILGLNARRTMSQSLSRSK